MNIKELQRRIERLRPAALMLLCRTPEGEEKNMGVRECIETGSSMICVIRGKNLTELDQLLAYEFANMRTP